MQIRSVAKVLELIISRGITSN